MKKILTFISLITIPVLIDANRPAVKSDVIISTARRSSDDTPIKYQQIQLPKRGALSNANYKNFLKDKFGGDAGNYKIPLFNQELYSLKNILKSTAESKAVTALKKPFKKFADATRQEYQYRIDNNIEHVKNSPRINDAINRAASPVYASGIIIAKGVKSLGSSINSGAKAIKGGLTQGVKNLKNRFNKEKSTNDSSLRTKDQTDPKANSEKKDLRDSQLEQESPSYNQDIVATGIKKDALFDKNQVIKQADGTYKFAGTWDVPEGYQLRKTKNEKYGLVENPKPKPQLRQKQTTKKDSSTSINSSNFTFKTDSQNPEIQILVPKEKDSHYTEWERSEYYNLGESIPSRRNSVADQIDQ